MFEKEAEEYRKTFRYYRTWHGQVVDKSPSTIVEQSFKDGFLAGLKAGRPQWHKADVPTSPINKVVLGYIKHYNSKLFCFVGWNGKWWYDAGTYNDEVKLIAWCEIPTFDKE